MADFNLNKEGVIVTVNGPVMKIQIDRPHEKNGMNWKAMNVLSDAYEFVASDPDIRVIVMTGTGEYFYTGGRVNAGNPEEQRLYAEAIARSGMIKKKINIPTIAAINGDCLKAGMGWLLEADMAVAKKSARFGFPEVRMGGVPMMVMVSAMSMPKKLALAALYSSDTFDAETAYQMGLVNCIVEDEDFWPTVEQYIHKVIDYPKALIQMTRDAYYTMAELPTRKERVAYAQKMLQEKVLPYMATGKTEYNV